MQNDLNTLYADFLSSLSLTKFTPMQEAVLEKAASPENMVLLAPTGSGKTIAYLIPLINKLRPESRGVQAMIVAPSRELALQIEQVFRTMKTNYKVSCCYGGHLMKIEQNSLQ